MKFALQTAQFGLEYAVAQLKRKGTPKALKVAKALAAADAAITEYLSTPDTGK
jgi:hypothetical protein